MQCRECGRQNRADSRFCDACGAGLVLTCATCSRELNQDARFCDGCGTGIAALATAKARTVGRAPPGEADAVRKTVTVLFCDLMGSTAFAERVDAESARDAMGRYHAMAKTVIEGRGGTVAKFIGDGVMALFGVPDVSEDDAERAVATGRQLQREFVGIGEYIADRYGVDVGLRVGINTGEVVFDDGDADLVGDVLNTAARLEAECAPGAVLVGEDTWRLTRSLYAYESLGELSVKGKRAGVKSFQLLFSPSSDDDHRSDSSTPFIGRESELAALRVLFDEAVQAKQARMASVIGSPGVGKTRLARELGAAVSDAADVFDLHCERAGAATFAPLVSMLQHVAKIDDGDTPEQITAALEAVTAGAPDAARVIDLLEGLLGAGSSRSTEDSFFGVRRLFEILASRRPVVVVIDDIQWAEPLLLDLLDHLAEWIRAAPILIIALARPELREIRPALTEAGRRVALAVSLEGLDAGATAQLATELLGGSGLPRALIDKLPASTDGNPLFVRELIRMLVGDGVVTLNDEDRWELAVDLDAVEVPPTIQSLLATRVERLPISERRLLELASVVGPEFPRGALAVLMPDVDRADLDATIERLRRKEQIEPTGTYWGNEPIIRFHHVLIRDAAYRRLLKGARADLHRQVGEWMEQTSAGLVGEFDVTIAFHFEQAFLYRRQLGDSDDQTVAVGRKAADLLGVAAGRALRRDDLAAAARLSQRAIECLADDAAPLADLLVLACEASLSSGDVANGRALVKRLRTTAQGDARLEAWTTCFEAQLAVLTNPGGLQRAADDAESAAHSLAALGDSAGLAQAHIVRAGALARLGRIGECERELDLALTAARDADDRRRITAVLGAAPVAALWGPSPVARAGGRCLDVMRLSRITAESPAVEATSMRCQAVLEALRGRFDTSRSLLAVARVSGEQLGLRHGLLETSLYAGIVELLAEDPVAAEPFLREAFGGLGQLGIGADAGQAAAYLARSLLQQGRLDEADELAADSAALAGQNLQTAIAARSAQAEILSARGDTAGALRLADEAVRLATDTDIVFDHASALATLARVRAAHGDHHGAQRAAASARELFTQKGATIPVALPVADGSSGTSPTRASPDRHTVDISAHEPWNIADRWTREFDQLIAQRRTDLALSRIDEDTTLSDRRQLVGGEYRGIDELTAGWSSNDGPRWTVEITTVATRGDFLALHEEGFRPAGGVIGSEMRSLSVIHWGPNGVMRRRVLFDVYDLPQALAELDAMHAATSVPRETADTTASPTAADVHEPWNLADRWTREFDGLVTSGTPAHALRFFDERTVMIDRRPLVGRTYTGLDEMHEGFGGEFSDGKVWNVAVTTIATRGDLVALHEETFTMANDELVGALRTLSLTQWSTDHMLATRVLFDPDDLRGAVNELDRLHAEMGEPDASGAMAALGTQLMNSRDIGTLALMHPDSRTIDHRALGWGELGSAEVRHRLESLFAAGGDLLTFEVRRHRSSPAVVCFSRSVRLIDDDGVFVEDPSIVVQAIEPSTGLTTSLDQYDPLQLAEAFATADSLIADSMSTMPPPNRAVFAGGLANAFACAGQTDLFVGCFADDFVAELADGLLVTVADLRNGNVAPQLLGYGVVERRVMSTIGDRLTLICLPLDGDQCRWSIEEVDQAGDLVLVHQFDTHHIVDAINFYDDRWLATTDGPISPVIRGAYDLGRCQRCVDIEGYEQLLADDFEFVDRRTLGIGTISRRNFIDSQQAYSPSLMDGPEASLTRHIHAQSDNVVMVELVLIVVLPSGATWDRLPGRLVLACRNSQLTHFELFSEDQHDAAIDRFHELDSSSQATIRNEFDPRAAVGARFRELLRLRRFDEYMAMIHPDFVAIDHRPLGWGIQDFAATRDRNRTGFDMAGDVEQRYGTVFRSMPGITCDERTLRVTGNEGGVLESVDIAIAVADVATGLITSLEQFSEDQLDDALARADELIAVASNAVPFPNAAVLASRAANAVARSGQTDLFIDCFADGFVADLADGTIVTLDDLRAGRAEPFVLGFGGVERQLVAALGDGMAMLRVNTSRGWVWSVEEVDESGRLARIAAFTPLRAAADHLDQRWVDSVAERWPSAQVVQEFNLVTRSRDVERARLLLHADFAVTDRRELGFGNLDRETYLTVLGDPSARDNQVVITRSVVHFNESVGVGHSVFLIERNDADLWEATSSLGVLRCLDGQLLSCDLFADDDVAGALASVADLDSSAEPGGKTAAERCLESALGAGNKADWAALGKRLAATVRLEDRRPVSGATVVGKQHVLGLNSLRSDAAGVTEVATLATRDDWLVLQSATYQVDANHGSSLEKLLVLGRTNGAGQLDLILFLDPDKLVEAVDELNELHLASLDPFTAGLFDDWYASEALLNRRDVDTSVAGMAATVRLTDTRPLGFGTFAGRASVRQRLASLTTMPGFVGRFTSRIHRVAPNEGCLSVCTIVDTPDRSRMIDEHILVVRQAPATGLIEIIEQFAIDDLDNAIDRFHELNDPGLLAVVNGAVIAGGQANRRAIVAGIDAVIASLADDFQGHGVGPATITVADIRSGAVSLESLGFGVEVREPIAVRGDHRALVRVETEGDTGARVWAVEETDADQRLVRVTHFASADLLAAVNHLEDRPHESVLDSSWLDDSIRRFNRAHRNYDMDALGAALHDDFVQIDHRPLGYPLRPKPEWLDLVSVGLDDPTLRGVALTSRLHHISERGIVGTGALWTGASDGEYWQGNGYTVVAFYQNGLLRQTELFPVEHVDAAVARFIELEGGAV